MVSGERLVTRPEVDYPAVAPLPGAQAAEHLTATEPADHQQLVRLRDIEPFTVHLFTLKFDVFRHPFKDRVTWAQVPQPLPVLSDPPFEGAVRAQQTPERLAEMSGMQHDQAHAAQYRLLHPVGHLVSNLIMRLMTPPDQGEIGRAHV